VPQLSDREAHIHGQVGESHGSLRHLDGETGRKFAVRFRDAESHNRTTQRG